MKKYFLFLAAFFQLFLCSVTLSAFGRQEIVAELERELNYWIRSLYPYELKKISWVKYQVELMPGRREYSLQYYDEKVKIDMPDHIDLSFLAVPDLALPNLGHITFATKRKYSAGVSSDFLRLFETEDALFAFIGVQALQKDVFRSDFSSILTEGEVGIIAEIMLKAKMNPYGYLEFLKNLHRFTNKNLNRKAPDLSKVKAILDKITGYDDAQQRKLTPLPASFLAKNYFETTIQNLVQTLVSPEGPPIVIADSSMNDEIDFSISYKPEGRTYTLLIPKKWDQAFASEDQFAALVTYGVLWKKAWDEKEDHDHWGAEEIAKLDMKVIDSLVKNLKISDSIGVHSLNPSEYYALLTRINLSQMKKSHASPQEKFQFKGFIEEISKTLQANTIDPSVRISVVQAYLQKIQIQYANEFLETHPIPILNEKRTFTKTLEIKPNPKTKRCLRDSDEDDETIEETESKQTKVLTYSELVNFISSHGDISNLDLIASKLVVQIPEEELTLPVIIKLFNEQEALPITTLSALNTYLSRISDDDWPEWNSVYDLIAKNGPVKTVEGYSFPGELCKAWERNHLKLLHGQIETSDLSSSSGRSELVQKLKNFSKTLGPCSNKQSETKIFKLLMDSDKIDRDFLIEWDTENRFEHENNKILLKKEVSPQFLQSKAFNTVDLPSKLAVKTIRTLPEDILDLDSLKDMDSRNIHPDYLNALVRRATELYRDPEDLVKLYSFILSKQPSLEKIPQQVYAQIVAATIREGKVTPENLLPPQNCHYSEPILDALVESSYSRVQSLYVISKIHGCQDLMKRYLMKKPFESFRDLIFFTLEFASYANQGILREIKTQELIFDQIGRQIPSGEYTLSNLKRFQNALLGSSGDSERTEHSEDVAENSDDPIESEESEESVSSAEKTDQKESQVRIPGLHYLFFVALKQFEDPEELALVHRIWLATTVQTDSKLASALLNEKASARNGYLKMVIGALEAEDQELILKYPMFSKSKVRKAVFRHLLDSSLSNEFIQRWIEAVFEGDAASSKRMQEREAYMETLHQKRPTRTLEEASQILNQTNYQGGDQISIWRDMKYLLRTVPSSEFTSKRVHRFVKSLDKDLAKIGSLAANAWLLKYTPEDKQTELSLIFHDIQQQQDIAVNRMFCRLLETNYQKMARAVIRENPQDLSELFTPSSFSLLNGSKCSINRSWTRELFELLEEEEIDREAVISWLAKYEELTLSRDFILAKRSQLNDLSSDLSHIPDGTFKQTLASKLVFGLEQDAFTWETVTSFWKTNPSISSASLEAVLRFMANTKDAGTLAKIHSFLAKHTREIDVNLSKKGCNLLRANFKRMLEGSFGQQEANDGLMEFTPAWLGCYSPGKFTETKHKDLATVLKIAIETGATSPEKLLAESDSFDKSQHQFRELGRQFFKKLDEVRDFQELGRLLSSAKEEGQSFLIPFSISDRILKKFASTEFERSKIEPIFKYLGNIHDRVQVLSWLIDRTQNDSDLEFALLELLKDGTASLSSLSGTLFRKLMLGSIRHNSENILLFPIETELIEKFGSKWLGKNWYNDRLIREVIHDWQGPKEYLLAWLKHLPSEFNKRDKAFRYFIKHAGIRSFEEWDHILTLAEKLEKPWMKDAPAVDHAAKALWSETNLRTLFKNLPDEQLASHKIVLFVLSDSSGKLQIDKSYALNWAMSKAVTPEDFVEIHENLRTQKHPEVSPEFSMISLLYRTAYTKMLKAVMDLEPESILDFYDLPIQKEVLEGYLSEALATRVRDDVLDELTTHLLSISKNLPSGVAWAWIDKNIPEKAEKLRRGTPNPKIPRTEALVQFAAKRGVLTFKDIPGEIKSAQNFHKEFNLPAKTQEAILQALPEESFTLKNLQSYAAMDDVWIKQGLGTSLLADPALGSAETFFEQQLRKRKDQQKLLATYQETKKIISENPILIYDLENSEKMQHLFINKMKEGGAWPKNFQKQHQILLSLAKRGPSELTDDLFYELYMNDKFDCAECLVETMKNRAFWDLFRRKDVYEKYLKLTHDAFDEENFSLIPGLMVEYAVKIVAAVNLFFPENSLQRSDILEKLSNDVKADRKLTKMIESEKVRGTEEHGIIALDLVNHLMNAFTSEKERMALVKFFVKGIPLPESMAKQIRQQVGVNRLRRQFLELPPYGKALSLNALIQGNLLPNPVHRKELERLIWENLDDENRDIGKLFYRSFVKAISEITPFEEPLFIAFLLGQLANVQDSHPGKKLKYILESLGGTGVSIGQKIYQRRMLPDDYLEHLKDMTDHSPLPSRHSIYERLQKLLGVKKVDRVAKVQQILGGASTALVVRVILQNKTDAALKMTFEYLENRTQLERKKMETALTYLVENGGEKYHRLWPVVQEVYDGLRNQEDLRLEQEKTGLMKSLYEAQPSQSDSSNSDQVQFKVIETLPDVGSEGKISFVGSSKEHVFMELAKGQTLTRVADEQRRVVFPAIFKKEMSVLLAKPGSNEKITFETDRHMGNFMADLSSKPLNVYVYDYPLVSSISADERRSLFKLIGWLEGRKRYATNLVSRKYVDNIIARILASEIADGPLAVSKVRKYVGSALGGKSETAEKLFALFAIIDEVGAKEQIRVKSALVPYVIALGHAERYSQVVSSSPETNAFYEMLEPHILSSDEKFSSMGISGATESQPEPRPESGSEIQSSEVEESEVFLEPVN